MTSPSGTFRVALATVLLLATPFAGAQSDFTLTVTAGSGAPGDSIASTVLLDNTGSDVLAGWSYGVCHDSSHVQLDTAEQGSTTATVNGGGPPDFGQINLFANGYTLGVVISFLGLQTLPPGTDYELTVATYSLVGAPGTSSTIEPCAGLGSPPVATVVVVGTSSIPVDTVAATAEILDVQPLEFSITSPPLYYDDAGVGSRTATVSVADPESPARETLGFAFGVALDPTVVTATGTSAIGPVAALDSGVGPEFYGETLTSEGVTIGSFYSLLLTQTLSYSPSATAIVTIDLETVPATFDGDPTGTTTDLTFSGDLGDPPIGLGVFVGQSLESVSTVDATLVIEPLPDLAIFRSGDANDDGLVDIADGQFILAYLFAGGTTPTCLAAADADGNGTIEIADPIRVLENLFSGGIAPEAPFPDCGVRVGVLPADCAYSSCP